MRGMEHNYYSTHAIFFAAMTEKYDEKRLTVPYEWRIKYLLQDSFNGLPEKKIQFCFALFFLKTCFSPLFIVCEILCNWLALRKGVKQI